MNLFDKLRTQKLLSFTLILFTLECGIVIGTLVNSRASRRQRRLRGARSDPAGDSQPGGTVEFVQPDRQAGGAVGGKYLHRRICPKAPARSRGNGRAPVPPHDEDRTGRQRHGRFSYRFFGNPFGGGGGMPEMPQRRGPALGSGVVVDRAGYILTNNHVVDKADRIQVKFTHDPTEYDAKVVGVDAATDLAVIRVEGKQDYARQDRQFRRRAGGRLGDGDRFPVRLPGDGDGRHHQRQGARCGSHACSSSISCRPMRPSTRATAAARC